MAHPSSRPGQLRASRILTGFLVLVISGASVYYYLMPVAAPYLPWAEQPAEIAATQQADVVDDRIARRDAARREIDEQITRMREEAEQPVPAEDLGGFVSPEQRITLPSPRQVTPDEPTPETGASTTPAPEGVAGLVPPHPQARPLEEAHAVTIPELLADAGVTVPDESLFYVHAVDEHDERGLWGIIHDGIVITLADGIRLEGPGPDTQRYQVEIPPGEDQPRADGYSSYLGQVIHEKTRATHVYNLQMGTMGQNPDLIHPGQELVIVGFTPDELLDIHDHFVHD